MIPLSRAIRRGAGADPLDAACHALGCDFTAASKESACMMAIRALHSSWPQLGQTVRSWPALAARMEELHLIAVPKRYQDKYNRHVHGSLYYCITSMHDKLGMTNEQIADVLDLVRL